MATIGARSIIPKADRFLLWEKKKIPKEEIGKGERVMLERKFHIRLRILVMTSPYQFSYSSENCLYQS